jgi:AcrR family transcriptional regulator
MTTAKRQTDRRVQRTRRALQKAFVEVVREKGFTATSIQDIAERANVNRGTFYLHFTDKYMLVDALIREDLQRFLANTLTPASRWDRETLQLLIQGLLDRFEKKYQHQPHVSRTIAPLIEVTPLIERVMHEELTEQILLWLKQSGRKDTQWRVPMETVARIVSWAIFGTAIQWSQEETTVSSEQMAHDILLVVVEGIGNLVPEALPE